MEKGGGGFKNSRHVGLRDGRKKPFANKKKIWFRVAALARKKA